MNTKEMRDNLQNIYLEWLNNYLTVAKFAEHLEIDEMLALKVIESGRLIHDQRTTESTFPRLKT